MIGEPVPASAEAARRLEVLRLLGEAETRLQAVAYTLGRIADEVRRASTTTSDPAHGQCPPMRNENSTLDPADGSPGATSKSLRSSASERGNEK